MQISVHKHILFLFFIFIVLVVLFSLTLHTYRVPLYHLLDGISLSKYIVHHLFL